MPRPTPPRAPPTDADRVFAGTADGRFERIVHHLVVHGGLSPLGLAPDSLIGRLPGSPWIVAVVRDAPGLEEPLRRFVEQHRDGGVELVLVGGGADAEDTLKGAMPMATGAGVHAWHVADDGAVFAVGANQDGRVRAFLEPPPGAPDWERFWEETNTRLPKAQTEMASFARGIRARRPVATIAILVGIGFVFLLEVAWGGSESAATLLALGALERERVLAGELWRLLSCTFLHGGVTHLAFNSYVLWVLGSMLERVLGTARFLLLYVLAGIGGSLLSITFGHGFSVGASGAVWGLLTAEMVLTWRAQGVLPEQLRIAMRNGSIQSLLLNIAASFMPRVDWAAHAGGGIVGALVALSGALTLGLPRWAEVPAGAEAPPDVVPRAVQIGAVVSAVLLVASIVVAVIAGRGWELG